VGIDLHLHRSVICRIDEQGNEIDWVRIDNDPKTLVRAVGKAGRKAPVAIEATYGWYWAVDALMAAKFEVHPGASVRDECDAPAPAGQE